MTFTHLVQEPSSGSRWGAFNSFLCTQVVKELACLWKDAMNTKLTIQQEGDGSKKKMSRKKEGNL